MLACLYVCRIKKKRPCCCALHEDVGFMHIYIISPWGLYVHIDSHTFMDTYIHTYKCQCACRGSENDTYIHTHIHTYKWKCACRGSGNGTYIHNMHTNMYIYINACMHTNIHTYIQMAVSVQGLWEWISLWNSQTVDHKLEMYVFANWDQWVNSQNRKSTGQSANWHLLMGTYGPPLQIEIYNMY